MVNLPSTHAKARRIRKNALLATVLSLGLGAAGATAIMVGNAPFALADPVSVDAPAPADFSAVVKGVLPAVVAVQVKSKIEPVADRGRRGGPDFRDLPRDHPFNEFFRRFGQPGEGDNSRRPPRRFGRSQGSGFFITEDGYMVTNHHVIDGAEEISVVLNDGRELDAEVVGSDKRTDLALLKVDGDDFIYVALADEKPNVGEWVVAVGNPFGLGGTVTAGIVSANGRNIGSGPYDDYIQIDAPVNRGNSGGPTFNTRGEVVGVNTAIFSPSGGNVGIAFAIPAAAVEAVVEELRDDGTVTRGWLGVQIQQVSAEIADSLGLDEAAGALVVDPQDDGPAQAAGIQPGDVITKVDGKAVEDTRSLARMIAEYDPKATVVITLVRGGDERQIKVTLGKLGKQAAATPKPDTAPVKPASDEILGLTLRANDDGQGLVVVNVDPDSQAAERGIQSGDVIVSVAGAPVTDVDAIGTGIDDARDKGRKSVLLQIENQRGNRFIALPLDKG